MGFFSNLKNAVTGGAADVQVQCQAVQRGTPAMVQIFAQAKSAGNVNGVYLLVRAVERCEVKDRDWEGGHSHTETVRGHRVSWEHRIPVSGAFQMQEGQQMQWQAQLHLPHDVGPSLQGHMISHTWEIQAGLDMTGNDPDSGWVTIQVYGDRHAKASKPLVETDRETFRKHDCASCREFLVRPIGTGGMNERESSREKGRSDHQALQAR